MKSVNDAIGILRFLNTICVVKEEEFCSQLISNSGTTSQFVNCTFHVYLKTFFYHIKQYNSMFAMNSMGAKVIDSINDGHGPYVFKISGQVYHRIGSLIPSQGARPKYAQLYLFNTEHEISNRINVVSSSRSPFHANEDIVNSLIQMLDLHNPIVKLFRTAPERLLENSEDHYSIRIYGDVDAHGDVFSFPVASEVVGLVVGDIGHTDVGRDIIIEDRTSNLQQINERHGKFMSMQYPILFPYGEDGFNDFVLPNRSIFFYT
jgi:hypothetical protein